MSLFSGIDAGAEIAWAPDGQVAVSIRVPSGAYGIRHRVGLRGAADSDPQTNRRVLRAAQYVRMSTDHQQYSTANQVDAIAQYAREHSMDLVRTYADEGKSGLSMQGRKGLQTLLSDVTSGEADFQVVLVYDVSRWGRFQDSDESAFYEFLCKRAGIHVEYCMESFQNDGTPMSAIVKSLKRMMAGEYSRELSKKVFDGKSRLTRLGYRQGGLAGYGLRRMAVDSNGKPRAVLEVHEQKFLQSDRVVLVPGPTEEQEVVRWIFHQVADHGCKPTEIARDLNSRGVLTETGAHWSNERVGILLSNEKYIGNAVFNRSSAKLKTRLVRNPPEEWIRADGAFEPIVEPSLFWKAQDAMAGWTTRITNESAIAALRALYVRRGELSAKLIDDDEGMPGSTFYSHRFGGLVRAYALVGCKPRRDYTYLEGRPERLRQIAAIRAEVMGRLQDGGVPVERESKVVMVVNGFLRLAVLLAFTKYLNGSPRWEAQIHTKPRPDKVLIARRVLGESTLKDYCLVDGGSDTYRLDVRNRLQRDWIYADSLNAILEVISALKPQGQRLPEER